MANHIAVLVAGSWGTALAQVLTDNGHQVLLWSRNEAQVHEINDMHHNHRFLPDTILSSNLKATSSIAQAVTDANAVVIVAPSSAMREVVRSIQPFIRSDTLVIHGTKGFETGSLKRMSEVIVEELPNWDGSKIVVLSGPSHAEEVIHQSPTTVVVASQHSPSAELAQELFMNTYFRVYTNPDVIGVEIAGSLKNIIAIAAGIIDGLGFGDNAKAALVTRGLAEMKRLGIVMGGNPHTFAGLSGIGDLVVTCTSKHSRNWRAGYMLAQDLDLAEITVQMGMVIEGVKTTQATYALSQKYAVDMPITNQLYQVLFEKKRPKQAIQDLMVRLRTHEFEE